MQQLLAPCPPPSSRPPPPASLLPLGWTLHCMLTRPEEVDGAHAPVQCAQAEVAPLRLSCPEHEARHQQGLVVCWLVVVEKSKGG